LSIILSCIAVAKSRGLCHSRFRALLPGMSIANICY
jgi:hypothetical protein